VLSILASGAGAIVYNPPYASSFLYPAVYTSGAGAKYGYYGVPPMTGNGQWQTFANVSTTNLATSSLYLEGGFNSTNFAWTGQTRVTVTWFFGGTPPMVLHLGTPCISSNANAKAGVWLNITMGFWDATLNTWATGLGPGVANTSVLSHTIGGCNKYWFHTMSVSQTYPDAQTLSGLFNGHIYRSVTWVEIHIFAWSNNDGAAYSCADALQVTGSCSTLVGGPSSIQLFSFTIA
jgi:hypothetical protein